jgi:hypothetical protein
MKMLLRVLANVDWKGRPHHDIRVLAIDADEQRLFVARDADIRELYIEELLGDEENGFDVESKLGEEDCKKQLDDRKKQLATETTDALKALWQTDGGDRWEMQQSDDDVKTGYRIFAWRMDGDFSSISYTIVPVKISRD